MYKIFNDAKSKQLISSKLKYMIDELGYFQIWDDGNLEDRKENYSELLRFVETFDDELIGLQEFLDNISLLNKRDERTNINECIKLMTLHSSKGLEFKYVYIIKALDGIIPNERSIYENLLTEERRLMYVGITRAKDQVFITASPFYGYTNFYLDISRFVKEAGIKINNMQNNDVISTKFIRESKPKYITKNQNSSNIIVELILTIFGGGFGLHYFYKRKFGMGLLYLFTVGLFGIGWIVDIFRVVIKCINKVIK